MNNNPDYPDSNGGETIRPDEQIAFMADAALSAFYRGEGLTPGELAACMREKLLPRIDSGALDHDLVESFLNLLDGLSAQDLQNTLARLLQNPGAVFNNVGDKRFLHTAIAQFLAGLTEVHACLLRHQLSFPPCFEMNLPSQLTVEEVRRLLNSRPYRYFDGGHGPFRGFLIPMDSNHSGPVFHVESKSEVLYANPNVRRMHLALVIHGIETC